MISVAAVALKDRQIYNQNLDRKKSVLKACWLIQPGEKVSAEDVDLKFEAMEPKILDLQTGKYVADIDVAAFDPEEVERISAPENSSKIQDLPTQIKVFQLMKEEEVSMLVLPVHGQGLWGPLLGYLALDADMDTIQGLTFYKHKETPGLGAEVDNPKWKKLWPGRKVYDKDGKLAINVIKGAAKAPEIEPNSVDGISGATLTCRGVTNLLHFWLGEDGYGPYLENFKAGQV
jgi:Na+-transporting NADH:ubiquinone oxidoreductase subunit C